VRFPQKSYNRLWLPKNYPREGGSNSMRKNEAFPGKSPAAAVAIPETNHKLGPCSYVRTKFIRIESFCVPFCMVFLQSSIQSAFHFLLASRASLADPVGFEVSPCHGPIDNHEDTCFRPVAATWTLHLDRYTATWTWFYRSPSYLYN